MKIISTPFSFHLLNFDKLGHKKVNLIDINKKKGSNMNPLSSLLLSFLVFFSVFLQAGKKPTPSGSTSSIQKFLLDKKNSQISWTGYKGLGDYIKYSHSGLVDLESGSVVFSKGELESFSINMNMESIKNTDIKDPSRSKRLENHLHNEDFFDTKKYKFASFSSTSIAKIKAKSYRVKGFMTIKNKSQNITFTMSIEKDSYGKYSATGKLSLDRTLWGILYKSKKSTKGFTDKVQSIFDTYKDKLIKDDFDIRFDVKTI